MVMAEGRTKLGRPYGAKYVGTVHVRMPSEVKSALRHARALTGISVSEVVRLGVLAAIGGAEAIAIERIESKKASGLTKIRMVDYLRGVARARLAIFEPDKAELLRKADRGEMLARLGEARKARGANRHRGSAEVVHDERPIEPPI